MKRKVLLIGWDAADWKIMKPLMEAGQMPCVSRFVERGVMGNLATLKPVLSPMLWNSIATGKRPAKHGILGFTELNPHTGLVSPSLSTSRKVKALWNIVSQEGGRSHVVNWFASHPAETINGVCVDETYSTPPKNPESKWELANEAIHPNSMYRALKELRLHPTELDGDVLQMFCPLADRVDQSKDKRIGLLAKQIVEAINVHVAATHILETEEWDFMGVYYGAIDHFCHLFMQFHPPKRPDVSQEDFEIYHDVINHCYRFHDVMLARLLELAGDDATVIVCSDHGFRSDHLRPPHTPMIPAGPAYWHRDQGIIMMAGPGVRQDELVHGATLLDIAPTVLSLLDLPVGKDMDGRVLSESLTEPERVGFIDSWETRNGDHPDGMHPPSKRLPPEQSQAILDQFVALGYIDPLDKDVDKAALTAKREAKWNLAVSLIDSEEVHLAIPLLAELVEDAPDRRDIVLTLANCLHGVGLNDEAERMTLATTRHDVDQVAVHHTLAEIALAKGNPQKALEYLQKIPSMTEANPENFSDFFDLGRSLTLGGTYLKLREWTTALEYFDNVLRLDPDHVRAIHGATQCLLRLKRFDDATDYALRSVELEYRSFLGHYLLGIALARLKDWERSEQAFSVAIRFRPTHIPSYRLLAVVFRKLGKDTARQNCIDQTNLLIAQREKVQARPPEAIDELRSRLEPIIPTLEKVYDEKAAEAKAKEAAEQSKASESVDDVEGDKNGDSVEAAKNKSTNDGVNVPSAKEFLIVSGLPRSGTSLMMQMLEAGGLSAMTDHERKADEDNPRGYFEWESIKQLKSNPKIIEKAEGKVTKVISMLLPHLPAGNQYKVIFVMRPIEEVVASQQKMIARLKTQGADLNEQDLIDNLTQHRTTILQLLRKMPVKVFMVKYEHLVNRTANVIVDLQKFIGGEIQLDSKAMIEQVRPELWRNKLPSQTI